MKERDAIAVIVVLLLLLLGGALFLVFKFNLVAALVAHARDRLTAGDRRRGSGRRGSGRRGRGMEDEEGL